MLQLIIGLLIGFVIGFVVCGITVTAVEIMEDRKED